VASNQHRRTAMLHNNQATIRGKYLFVIINFRINFESLNQGQERK